MSRSPISFGKIDVGLTTSMGAAEGTPSEETPFRVLLLGDFSGRASRGVREPGQLAARKPIRIDRDNSDEVLAKLGAQVRLTLGDNAPALTLRFADLDDFHPDRIVKQVRVFDQLQDLRRRLN